MTEANKHEPLTGYTSGIFKSPVAKRYAYVTGRDVQGCRTQQIVLSEEHDYAQNVKEAACAVYAVVSSQEVVFAMGQGRLGREVVRATKEGTRLLLALQLPFEDIEATLPQHYINPLFSLLRQHRDKHVPDATLLSSWKSLVNEDAKALYEALESLVKGLREAWKDPGVRKALDAARRRSDKRWKSMKRAIAESFLDCSKLVAMRLDLSFHSAPGPYPFAPDVSESEAYGCMVKFARYLRDHYPLVRYMWSLEYGTQTGFHFHVLVLLNGHLVQDGLGICMKLGEHWQNVITEGRGRYFNCNANDYKNPGLGMIHNSKPDAVERLIKDVAWYLTKTDFWMRYEAAGKAFVISVRYRQPSPGGAKRKLQGGAEGGRA